LPSGVDVTSLYQATMTKSDLVAQALAHHASYENNAFVALNTAFIRDGAFVHIPDGVVVEEPIHLLFLSTLQSQDTVSYPRVLIITGKQSQATVIESYGALTDDRYFTNSVTEIVVGKGAVVRYLKLQRQSVQSYHITNTHAVVTRDGSFSSVNLDFGGGLVRNNLNVLMDGEGGSCALTGLYMPGGRQHVDNQVIIDHARGYTNAKELYNGVLNDHARSVFHGSIIVRAGAKKVNAEQVDKNLLLSPHCEADTKPAFWIYCDDVRCGHGAACGQIDERQLFYLRSRGLSEQAARSWLVRGFVAEVVDTIRQERYKKHVDKLVEARLQEWLANDGPG
jgi:Fe-S cluster assembly protein SufD